MKYDFLVYVHCKIDEKPIHSFLNVAFTVHLE